MKLEDRAPWVSLMMCGVYLACAAAAAVYLLAGGSTNETIVRAAVLIGCLLLSATSGWRWWRARTSANPL